MSAAVLLAVPMVLATITALAADVVSVDGACGDPATPIHDVQGNGAATPIPGATVTVQAPVTVVIPATGYFAQETEFEFDADPRTSEGIFVVSSTAPQIGEVVRVTGVVTEFRPAGAEGSRTQLTASSDLICSAGPPVPPVAFSLPVAAPDDWEPYESMLISVVQALTVTGTADLGPADEIDLAINGRLSSPTSVAEPGAEASAVQDLNDRSRIRSRYDWRTGGLSAADTVRVGDALDQVLVGALDQRPDGYRLEPADPASLTFSHGNLRPSAPPDVGGILRVASVDLGSWFTTLDVGGANTVPEVTRQRAKLVAALAGLDADVVGITGVENDDGAALADLVAALDLDSPSPWAAVETGSIGIGATKVGIIYRTTTVTPVDAPAVLDSSVDAGFDDTTNRPSLAQTISRVGGARVTIIVNDLASRDADCDGDGDSGDGQGGCNDTRTAAADTLVDWVAADPTASGDPDAIMVGNFNAHTNEDPIDAVRSAGFTDILADNYSSVSAGQTGSIDHAFASTSLGAQITGSSVWHINADEPALLDYNTESKSSDDIETLYAPTPYRSASRDPLLIGINLIGESPVAADDSTTTEEDRPVGIDVAANDRDPNGDLDQTSVTLVTPPDAGAASAGADGTVLYTPQPDTNGTDTFEYQICDTLDRCDQADVTINVTAVDDTPVAEDLDITTKEDEPAVIDVTDDATDADGNLDPDSVTVVKAPAHGTAMVGSPITYSPSPDFHGTDSLVYQICDTTESCDQATITLTVTAANDPPLARRDAATVTGDGRVTIDVLANDTDPDGRTDLEFDSLTITDRPSRGNATVKKSGPTISYTARTTGTGTDELTYRICDQGGLCDTAIVDIHIDQHAPTIPSSTSQTLASTGSNANGLVAAAITTLPIGAVLLALGNRRRETRP